MSEVYYGTAVLIGYMANWRTAPTMQLVGDSSIDENEFGDEDRISNWHHLRQQVSWLVSVFGAQERGRITETLRIARDKKICAAPSWLELRCISSATGLQGVLNEEPDFDWQAGKHLWYGRDDGSYGIIRVKSVNGTSIEIFDDGVVLSRGMWVAPMIVGRLVSGVPTTDSSPVIRDLEITVCETGGNETGLIRKVVDYLWMDCGLDADLKTIVVVREDPNSAAVSLDFDANLETIVMERTGSEGAALGLEFDAILETVS